MTKVKTCSECESLEIIDEPKEFLCGHAMCKKFNVIITFREKEKLERTTCDLRAIQPDCPWK